MILEIYNINNGKLNYKHMSIKDGTAGYYAGIATEMTGSNKLFTFYANDRGNTPSFSEK